MNNPFAAQIRKSQQELLNAVASIQLTVGSSSTDDIKQFSSLKQFKNHHILARLAKTV